MSGFGRVAGEAVVGWWLSGAGSRRSSEPQAEATRSAPKQAADRHGPLASRSEGFVFVNSKRGLWFYEGQHVEAEITRAASEFSRV